MRDPIEVHEVNGFTVEICFDTKPWNPREWDNLGIMVCSHRRYDLGDVNLAPGETHKMDGKILAQLPLYLYDHSGLAMRTAPFRSSWDSGQVGYIYTTEERREWLGTPKDRVKSVLEGEVETYNEYLTGQVFGFVIRDPWDDVVESVWSFYGGIEHCREDAITTAKGLHPPNIIDRAKRSIDAAVRTWQQGGLT